MNCGTLKSLIKKLNIEEVKFNEEGKKYKPYKFNPFNIDFSTVYDLVAGNKVAGKKNPFTEIYEAIDNPNVMKKLSKASVLDNYKKKNPLLKNIDETDSKKAGQILITRSIVMKNIIGSIKSEYDEMQDKHLTEAEENSMYVNGARTLRSAGLAQTIGREISLRLGVAVKGDENTVLAYYDAIGSMALEEVAKNTGIIKLDGGKIINNKFNKNSLASFSRKEAFIPKRKIIYMDYSELGLDMNNEDQVNIISNMLDKGIDLGLSESNSVTDELKGLSETSKIIHRMSIPSTISMPLDHADKKVSFREIQGTPATIKLHEELQSKPLIIDQNLGPLFSYIGTEMETRLKAAPGKGDYGFIDVVKQVFPLMDNKDITAIFGGIEDDYNEENRDSALGQSLSRTMTIQHFGTSWDNFFNRMDAPKQFFTHDMYRNARVGLVQQIVNGQIDKFFSRNITASPEIDIGVGSDIYNHLVMGISDDVGVELGVVHDPHSDPGMSELLSAYEELVVDNSGSEAKQANNFAKFMIYLSNGKVVKKTDNSVLDIPMKKGGVWAQYRAVKAMYNIANRAENNTVKSDYQTKPDASGSGVIIQLLQALGVPDANKYAYELLDKLGYTQASKARKTQILKDVYDILLSAMKDNNRLTPKQVEQKAQADELVNLGFVSSLRDIAKYPTMITAYLAGKNSVMQRSAEEYLDNIKYSIKNNSIKDKKPALTFLKKIVTEGSNDPKLKEAINKSKSMKELMDIPKVEQSITRTLKEGAGAYGHALIQEELTSKITDKMKLGIEPVYNKWTQLLKENQDAIAEGKDISPLLIKTLPAQVVVDLHENSEDGKDLREEFEKNPTAFRNKYGMRIMSKVQVLNDNDTVSKVEAPNMLTSIVNVIHSIDSAIMHVAHKRTLLRIAKEIKSIKSKSKRSASDRTRLKELEYASEWGSTSVHDANNANAIYNQIFEEEYRDAIIYVNSLYDIQEQLTDSYNDFGNQMIADGNEKIYGSFEEVVDPKQEERLKSKKDQLKTMAKNNAVSFGYDLKEAGSAPKVLTNPGESTKAKTETKTETEPETDETETKTKTGKAEAEKNNQDVFDIFVNTNPEPKILKAVKAVLETSNDPILKDFMETKNALDNVINDTSWEYIPSKHKITVSEKLIEELTLEESIAHEIVHFATTPYFLSKEGKADKNVKYLKAFAKKLSQMDEVERQKLSDDIVSDDAEARMTYIISKANKMNSEDQIVDAISEITAILKAEPRLAKELYAAIDKSKLGSGKFLNKAIDAIWNAIKTSIAAVTDKNIKADKVDIDILASAVEGAYQAGVEFNKNNPKASKKARESYRSGSQSANSNETIKTNKDAEDAINESLNYTDPLAETVKEIPFIEPIWNSITETINSQGKTIFDAVRHSESRGVIGNSVDAVDSFMTDNFPLYYDNKKRLVDLVEGNADIIQHITFIHDARVGAKTLMNDIVSIGRKAERTRNDIDDKNIARMNKAMKDLSEEQVSSLFWNFAATPIFNLISDGEIYDLIDGKKSIDQLINKYEKKLNKGFANRASPYVENAKDTADMLTKERYIEVNTHGYNIEQYNIPASQQSDVKKLISLYSMQNSKTANDALKILKDNDKLKHLIVDASSALNRVHKEIRADGTDAARWRENLIRDTFDESYDFRPVTLDQLNDGKFKTTEGWDVLRRPINNVPGIVYRIDKEATFQHGPGTSISYNNSDILLNGREFENFNSNVVKTSMGRTDSKYKLILTKEEKQKLGLIENPAEALYRSYSRLIEIQDTQIVRDVMIMDGITETVGSEKELAEFDASLQGLDAEYRIWQIKLPESMSVNDIIQKENGKYKYPNIVRYYMEPDKKSSIREYNTKFDLVRKDMIPLISGYSDPVLFDKYPPFKKAAYAVRGLVKLAKIAWTVLSPIKITNDAISNIGVLGAYGVSPISMWKYGKRAVTESKSYQALTVKELDARLAGNNKELAKIHKEMKEHPYHFMYVKGLVSSIKTDILSRDTDVVSGIQKDIEKIINKITTNSDTKELNGVGDIISQFAKWGFKANDLLMFAGEKAENYKYLESIGEFLTDRGQNIKDIESEEDYTAFMSEVLMLPGSQAVDIGSYLVHVLDQIGRYTLVHDLINKGMTAEEAYDMGRVAFTDWNKNPPKALKFLSDYGILLFPAFWMRTPKIMIQAISRKPINIAAGVAMTHMLDIHFSNISDPMVNMLSGSRDIVNAPPLTDGLGVPPITAMSFLVD